MSSIFVLLYDNTYPITPAVRNNYWHRAEGTPQTIDTVGANLHFVGRFRPYTFNRPYQSWNMEANVGEFSVEPHFIGKFQPPVYQRIGYRLTPTDGTPQTLQTTVEPHFIGTFRPNPYQRIKYLPENEGLSFSVETSVEPSFIAKFQSPVYGRIGYNWTPTDGTPQVIDTVGANPHFVGKFQPHSFTRPYQNLELDIIVQNLSVEPHFIGKFQQYVYNRLGYNVTPTDGSSQVIDIVGANPHFVGKFQQYQYTKPYQSYEVEGTPQTLQVTVESHFVGKFNSYYYQRVKYLPDNEGLAAFVETSVEPSFITIFQAPVYRRIGYNFTPADGMAAVVDTVGANPHFVGKYQPSVYQRILSFPTAQDSTITPTVDNPRSFVASFRPYLFNKALNSYSLDGIPAVVDTIGSNPHFVSKFTPYSFNNKVLFYNSAVDTQLIIPDLVGANPHFLTKYKDYVLLRLPYFVYETSIDGPPPAPPALIASGRYITEREVEEALHKLYKHVPTPDTVYSQAAKELGREGGLKGGPARAASLTSKQRSTIASNAAKTRWKK